MVGKRLLLIAVTVILTGIIVSIAIPAIASPLGQGITPPEHPRPDQFAYHGREEIPYLDSQAPSQADALPLDTPIGQWSRMAFQTYVGNGWEVMTADGDFNNIRRLTSNGSITDIGPRLDRGCNRIVYFSDRGTDTYSIFRMNADGSNAARLTETATDEVEPAWSPDGTRIAFQSYRDGNAEVYVMNADGSAPTNLSHSPDYDGMPSWSPDGSRIAFTSRRTGGYRIWVMNADGSNPLMLSQQAYSEGSVWSPDGSQIGYDADADGDNWQELWSMNADGSQQRLRVDASGNSTIWATGWSPDGGYLLHTYVHMVYYYGNWYWDYSALSGITANGWTQRFNPYRDEDWRMDWTTCDVQPPVTGFNHLNSPAPYQFTVSWWGQDAQAGIADYSVQVRDGLNGAWTAWLPWTEATSAVYTGVSGHDYYFRVRGRDKGYNEQPWPADYQATAQVETFAPYSKVASLEPFIRGNQVPVTWQGGDIGGSGILAYDIQSKMDQEGAWITWLSQTTQTSGVFSGMPGHTYSFRSRAIDNALNAEKWPEGEGDASTSLYSWKATGSVRDNTGVPLAGAEVSIEPAPFLAFPSGVDGSYSAYLGDNPDLKTITWSKEGYGSLPPTAYGLDDAQVDAYLPPPDNQVMDWGFESGQLTGTWQSGGVFTPTLDDQLYHSGGYAASLGTPSTLGAPQLLGTATNTPDNHKFFATDPLGGLHAAWPEFDNGCYIYYAYRSPVGTWSPKELALEPTCFPSYVSIMVDSNLNVHMLYAVDNHGVYYTWRDANGTWSSPFNLNRGNWYADVMMDSSDTIHALLIEGGRLIYAYLVPGGGWQYEDVPGSAWYLQSAMAVDTAGKVHVAWTLFDYSPNGSKIFYQVRDTDGDWQGPGEIFKLDYPTFGVDLLLDSSGLPYVLWTASGDQPGFYFSQEKPNSSWTTPYEFSGGSYIYHFSVSMDGNNSLTAVWNTGTAVDEGVYTARKDRSGAWSMPQRLSNTGTHTEDVAADNSGSDIYAIWDEGEAAPDIFYSHRRAGTWSEPIKLTNYPGGSDLAGIEVDALGSPNIAYSLLDGGALDYIGTQPITQTGDAWIAQALTIPPTMTHPTLSFLAYLSGISEVSGNALRLQVTSGMSSTTVLTDATPSGWEQHWFDMTPWLGQPVTITFQLTENAGCPPASALLDEVSLGEAHADVWVNLSGGAENAHPGDQLVYRLDYGNRGGVLADRTRIVLTLPAELSYVDASLPPEIIGDQLIWQIGELPAASTADPIELVLEVNLNAQMPKTVTVSVGIATAAPELETLNNTSQLLTYLGYIHHLPLVRRQ